MPKILKSGAVLKERYNIQRIIGQGGMGSIFLADDLRLEGRKCAIKVVEQDNSLPADLLKQARDQFQREATVLARLDHPNLPKVSDFFSDDQGCDYLVMDFVPGKDLRTMMIEARRREEFLEERHILNWAGQLANALIYLHNQDPPILHRDIKPSNLKVTPSGVLKLVDFGLVKLMAPDEMTITVLQGRGTALYTPLEQYGGDAGQTDFRSDVYSFGATLYHLFSGHAPMEARERFLNPGKLPSLQDLNPTISSRTQRAVLWAMNLHPEDRPASIEIFRKALLGEWNYNNAPGNSLPKPALSDILSSPVESSLALATVIFFVLGLIITLTHL